MTKVVWHYTDYDTFRRTGVSAETLIVPDDFNGGYGYTDIEPPVEMQTPTSVPFFNAQTQTWADYSEEAQIIAIKQNKADLSAAKQDAAEAKAENAMLKDTVTTVKGALKELMTYVATLQVPDTTSTTTSTQGGAE